MTTAISFTQEIPYNYRKYLTPLLFESYAEELASKIDVDDQPLQVLEIAAGTGMLTQKITKVVAQSSKILATDKSVGMLTEAKGYVTGDNVQFETVDANDTLPYEDETFDVVIMQFGLMFFLDKLQSLKEMSRVLKPGGQLIFNTWDKLENNEIWYLPCKFLSTQIPQDIMGPASVPFSLYDPDELYHLIQATGLENIAVDKVEIAHRNSDALSATLGIIKGSFMYNTVSNYPEHELDALIEKTADYIRETFGGDPPVANLSIWSCHATKALAL